MDSPVERSASVTAAAVVAILGSLFFLLCCSVVFFGMLLGKLPGSQNYGWAVILGLVVAGAVLALLVYYRPRFLEAASRAAAVS